MKPAALGFRVHSGWTSLIALAIEKKQPVILARQRPHLVATFSYTFRQPYHTAERMDLVEAGAFLEQQRSEARALALVHTADGEFFREALLHACARADLAITTIKERELFATASAALRRKPAILTRFVSDLGKPLGSPWTQDEKFATLAAWLALAVN